MMYSNYPGSNRVIPMPNGYPSRGYPSMPYGPAPYEMRSSVGGPMPYMPNMGMMPNNMMMRSSLPLSIPKGGLLKGLFPSLGSASSLGTKGMISKVLSGTENVIATVNQVIPIYQQVKPLWDNSKGVRSALKKFFPFSKTSKSTTKENKEVIENPEIITPKKETKKTPVHEEEKEQNEPNQPFF